MESLPQANLKIRLNPSGIKEIYDIFRKKYVKLSPEEEVRQNFLHYLVNKKGYPVSLISVERGLVRIACIPEARILSLSSGLA